MGSKPEKLVPHKPRQYERNGGRREEAEELGQGCKWEEDSYVERGIEGTESGIISGERRGTSEIGSSTTRSHRPPNLQLQRPWCLSLKVFSLECEEMMNSVPGL